MTIFQWPIFNRLNPSNPTDEQKPPKKVKCTGTSHGWLMKGKPALFSLSSTHLWRRDGERRLSAPREVHGQGIVPSNGSNVQMRPQFPPITSPHISYPAVLKLGGIPISSGPVSVGDSPTESWSNRLSS
jgi:hypothetical protein